MLIVLDIDREVITWQIYELTLYGTHYSSVLEQTTVSNEFPKVPLIFSILSKLIDYQKLKYNITYLTVVFYIALIPKKKNAKAWFTAGFRVQSIIVALKSAYTAP
jgi:hypothetical protein